jgi:magnesium chelatase accessory protein
VVIGINPALAPFDGVAGWLFPMMAKLMALNPFIPALVSMGAAPEKAQRLIEGTGSVLDADGYALYARLLGDRAHVNGTLQMMARWDLGPLLNDLPEITTPTRFVTGLKDRAVAPDVADTAAARMNDAQVIHLEDLGHLAHEEDPERLAGVVDSLLADTGAAVN